MASRTTGGVATGVEFNAFDELVADGTASYAYDGLNRLVEADGAALSYVGTGIKVASDHTGDYTYTPDGTPLGMTHTGGAGLAWTDSHTDLIGLINPSTGDLAGSRTYSPFGEQTDHHGTQPALGYQHQYTDPDTGNVNMGARWYQPHTSTFTNRDTATLNPHDLTNANRHTYAANNPLTYTDHSGYFLDAVWEGIKEISGYNDVVRCFGGSWSGCGWAVAGLTPWGKVAKLFKRGESAATSSKVTSPSVSAPTKSLTRAQSKKIIDGFSQRWRNFGRNVRQAIDRAMSLCGGRCGVAVTRAVTNALGKNGNRASAQARAADAAIAAATQSDAAAAAAARAARIRRDVLTPHKRPEPTPTLSPEVRKRLHAANNAPPINLGVLTPTTHNDNFADAITTNTHLSTPRTTPAPRSRNTSTDAQWSASCTSNSFVAGTQVVMADGSAKPIEDVELGEFVVATDPETGESGPRKVVATITGSGEKDLVEITVDTDGDTTETITATDGHPFWVPNQREWVPAAQLQPGDWLRTGSGTWVQVQHTHARTAQQRVHNLTINQLHTYYVQTETTPVLVHNCNNASTHDPANIADQLEDNIYFHYTSEEGHRGIVANDGHLKIGANSAGKVHVTQNMGNPLEIERDIFMGSEDYAGKADFMLAFQMPNGAELLFGSQDNERILRGSLKIPAENVIFHGRNPF